MSSDNCKVVNCLVRKTKTLEKRVRQLELKENDAGWYLETATGAF
jgi:hypothetical protein